MATFPITQFAIEYDYRTLDGMLETVSTTLTLNVGGFVRVLDGLRFTRGKSGRLLLVSDEQRHEVPKATKVIHNDPATIMFFGDDKVVTKCSKEDEYDMQLGMLLCALRKAGRNRARVDDWEPILSDISYALLGPKDLRLLADTLNVTADAMENAETYVQGKVAEGKDA